MMELETTQTAQSTIEKLVNDFRFTAPKCTCDQVPGVTWTITPNNTTASPWKCNGWRDCEAAYHRRVDRADKQLQHEMIAHEGATFYIDEISQQELDKRKFTYNKRQTRGANVRWRWYPQEDLNGEVYYFVIHNQDKEGGETLASGDYGTLYELLYDAVNAPEAEPDKTGRRRSMRCGGSAGWGQEYALCKGNTLAKTERENEPTVTVKTRGFCTKTAAEYFSIDIPEGKPFEVELPWKTVLESIHELIEMVGGTLQTIDGRPVLPAEFKPLIDWQNGQMSLLKDIDLTTKENAPAEYIPKLGHFEPGEGELTAVFAQSHLELQPKQPPGECLLHTLGVKA